MRELTQGEMAQVVGGDGFNLGNLYVSGTRTVTGLMGVAGAASMAFQGGYLIGTGINMVAEAYTGSSYSDRLGNALYENS